MDGMSAEGRRLVDTLRFGSLGGGTSQLYERRMKVWRDDRSKSGQSHSG